MSKKKLYFTTTEIAPFANITSLAKFSERIPLFLQEKDMTLEQLFPNGYISERKYILRN